MGEKERGREVIAFVSFERLLMKIQKTVRIERSHSEFEREIRADDVLLECDFALKISLKSVSTRRRGATRVKSSFEHFDIVSPARTARAKDQHDCSTERTSRDRTREKERIAL